MLRAFLVIPTVVAGMTAFAQTANLGGNYAGMLGPYHVKLHIIAGADGRFTGTADNTDAGMVGMACENIRLDGQTLSFTVPMVHGTWTGFVGADGTLSGMWSQGASPMPLNFARISDASAAGSTGAPAGANAPGEVKWDDYVFRFTSGGNATQVYQGGKLVGTILTVNGQLRVIAMAGTDSAKLEKSYMDYQAFNARSHGEAPPPIAVVAEPAASAPSATPMDPRALPAAPMAAGTGGPEVAKSLGFSNNGKADPNGIKFDGKSVVVPRTDGMVVTFIGEDVTIGGERGPMYVLRRKKASVGRAFEQSLEHSRAVGGGIAGGGIEFLRAGGGLIYDSGMGGYNVQESPGVRMAKQLALVAVDAVDAVRQVPGHADFKPSGYNGLKEVSQYRLRSDGSR